MGCVHNREKSRRRAAGFTLAELLIVIAILSLVAMVLAPAMQSVRRRARRTQCMANLRQVGLGVSLYAVDHSRALPTHHREGGVVFDTFAMRTGAGEEVNLGLLVDLVGAGEVFYCPGQGADRSPCIAYDSARNRWRWRWGQSGGPGSGGDGGADPPGSGSGGAGPNASFTARTRLSEGPGAPTWTLLNHTNKVIYTDFIGVDDWPGGGRLAGPLRAPHASSGYNRLFGDGSVLWAPAERVNDLRRVDAVEPTPEELSDYFQLLDVMP